MATVLDRQKKAFKRLMKRRQTHVVYFVRDGAGSLKELPVMIIGNTNLDNSGEEKYRLNVMFYRVADDADLVGQADLQLGDAIQFSDADGSPQYKFTGEVIEDQPWCFNAYFDRHELNIRNR